MNRFLTVSELKAGIDSAKTVGFVPTMGALHWGHISLVEMSKSMCDITVVSIFVNPTQFNDRNDYNRYPRDIEADCQMLEEAGCDLVFIPSEKEIYPQPDTRIFDFGLLDKVMEGLFRPGHFNGVAQVVSRLFDIINPDMAFFGQKDFQQTVIIKEMVRQLNIPTKIIVAPIVREANGLAMSSRNKLLMPENRENASLIHEAMMLATEFVPNIEVKKVKDTISTIISKSATLKVEYIEIVDGETLQPISRWTDANDIYICVAVYAGKIRLIDNLRINPFEPC
ncbi:MAG: pantoate--beta-alanine ligase [Prevotellaceae bacterium]|jgi:pantoate--beta-alanine ligase|nr:pantoate--beta-alanine ligase [Prevotellaceae bacterium]